MGAFGNYSAPKKFEIDHTDKQPIQVIANFATVGKFIPIYFKYIAADQEIFTYKIDAIKYTRENFDNVVFCCLYSNHCKQYEILLTFWTRQCVWTIPNK